MTPPAREEKILLIDEDKNYLRTLSDILLEQGYRNVIAVSDGLLGLELARKEKPSLIIMDVLLPQLDGFHLCAMLKFDEKFKTIPVILLSGKGQDSDKDIAKSVRADAFMSKPLKPELLNKKMKELLKQ